MSIFVMGGAQSVQTQGFINSISLGGNTAGNTSAGSGSVVYAGGSNVTLSANTAAGGETVSFVAGNPQTVTHSIYMPPYWGSVPTNNNWGASFMQFFPAPAQENYAVSAANMGVQFSLSTSSNSSWSANYSFYMGVYTRNVSTLSLGTSGSQSYAISMSSDNQTSLYSGARFVSIPLAASMTPGDYWIGVGSISASTNANWITGFNLGYIAVPNFSGFLGSSNASRDGLVPGFGQFVTAAPPSSVSFGALLANGANRLLPPMMALVNYST